MIINVEVFKSVSNCYVCRLSNDNGVIYIIETSFDKQKAVTKALDRLYVKLCYQGIDPNSVTLKRII